MTYGRVVVGAILLMVVAACQNEKELADSVHGISTTLEATLSTLTEARDELKRVQDRLTSLELRLEGMERQLAAPDGLPAVLSRIDGTTSKTNAKAALTAALLETPMMKEKLQKAFPDCGNYDIRVEIPMRTSGVEFSAIGVGASTRSLKFECFVDEPEGTAPRFLLKTATEVVFHGKDKLEKHIGATSKVRGYSSLSWSDFQFRLTVSALTEDDVMIASTTVDVPIHRVTDSDKIQATIEIPASQMKAVAKIVPEWQYRG